MAFGRQSEGDDQPASFAERMRPQSGEVWWYRQGAYIATAIVAAGIWFVMIGPKEFTPKSTMVDPAIDTLNTGVPNFQDAGQLSKKLKFRVRPPDLRQLGCKVTRSSIAEFGGQPSAVFQYQYGKSVVLMYSFNNPSVLFKEMKQVHQARSLFYCSSSGPATVVAWKDRRSGYFAIAAKATEKDLVVLAGKIVEAF